MKSPADGSAGLEFTTELGCRAAKFKELSGDSLSFVFDHRLSAVLDALFPLKISFCPLSGLI